MKEITLHIKSLSQGEWHLYSNELPEYDFRMNALDIYENFEEKVNDMVRSWFEFIELNPEKFPNFMRKK